MPPVPVHGLEPTVCAPACALSGPDGQIRPTGLQGLFVGDVRVLHRAVLRFAGADTSMEAAAASAKARTA